MMMSLAMRVSVSFPVPLLPVMATPVALLRMPLALTASVSGARVGIEARRGLEIVVDLRAHLRTAPLLSGADASFRLRIFLALASQLGAQLRLALPMATALRGRGLRYCLPLVARLRFDSGASFPKISSLRALQARQRLALLLHPVAKLGPLSAPIGGIGVGLSRDGALLVPGRLPHFGAALLLRRACACLVASQSLSLLSDFGSLRRLLLPLRGLLLPGLLGEPLALRRSALSRLGPLRLQFRAFPRLLPGDLLPLCPGLSFGRGAAGLGLRPRLSICCGTAGGGSCVAPLCDGLAPSCGPRAASLRGGLPSGGGRGSALRAPGGAGRAGLFRPFAARAGGVSDTGQARHQGGDHHGGSGDGPESRLGDHGEAPGSITRSVVRALPPGSRRPG